MIGMRKLATYLLGAALLSAIGLEVGVRAAGYVDFPLYDLSDDIKYIPRAQQAGKFENLNDWYFNDKNMPVQDAWNPSGATNVLLIGNSIVMGGNPYKQADKLVSQVQDRLGAGKKVWPIAAGGWSQPNEIAYLRRHPELAEKTDYVAWEYMVGGLSFVSLWRGDYVFPTQKPVCAACYVFRRYVLPRYLPGVLQSELPPMGVPEDVNLHEFDRELTALLKTANPARPGFLWLFPDMKQFQAARRGENWLPERPKIEDLAKRHGLRIVDVASNSEWREDFYRDGVHPNLEGNKVLGSILAAEIAKDYAR